MSTWEEKVSLITTKNATGPVRKQVVTKPKFEELENSWVKFLKLARDHGRAITSPTLCQLAREESKDLKIEDFKAFDE